VKNIVYLQGQEFIDFIRNSFTFPDFKNDTDAYISSLLSAVSKYPVAVYDPEPLERTQFSSWWRHLQRREYHNPYITDLYLIHELEHMVQLQDKYDPLLNDDAWFRQITENELRASLMSEAVIYILYPELRKKTFDHKIWFDRFNGASVHDIEIIGVHRLMAMIAPDDDIEKGIAKYTTQNAAWAAIWKDARTTIDFTMKQLINSNDIDGWKTTIAKHTTNNVVFEGQTKKFNKLMKKTIITLHKV